MIFVKVSSKVFMIEFASSDWLDDNVDDSSPFIRIATLEIQALNHLIHVLFIAGKSA